MKQVIGILLRQGEDLISEGWRDGNEQGKGVKVKSTLERHRRRQLNQPKFLSFISRPTYV